MQIRELCAECGTTHDLQLVRCVGCEDAMTVCAGCLEDVERRYTCEFCLEEMAERSQDNADDAGVPEF